jgi:site-specific DNA-methyltransferase (adenine-specific)
MNAQTQQVMFSSKSNEWTTPKAFFDKLDKIFGPFTLDPCCDGINNLTQHYFTEQQDGLSQSWQGHTVFMNPPYSRGELKRWIQKAHEESQKKNTMVVALIPSRTDTKYWHEYVMKARHIMFVKGRIKFGDGTNSAPFPSAVVVFDSNYTGMNPTICSITT